MECVRVRAILDDLWVRVHIGPEEMHCPKQGYHAPSISWHILVLRLNLHLGKFFKAKLYRVLVISNTNSYYCG